MLTTASQILERVRRLLTRTASLLAKYAPANGEHLFNKRLVLLAEKEFYNTNSVELSEACNVNAVSSSRMPLMRPNPAQRSNTYELSPEEFPSETLQHFEAEGDFMRADKVTST